MNTKLRSRCIGLTIVVVALLNNSRLWRLYIMLPILEACLNYGGNLEIEVSTTSERLLVVTRLLEHIFRVLLEFLSFNCDSNLIMYVSLYIKTLF